MQKRHTQILLLDRGPLGAKHRARTRDIVTLATSGGPDIVTLATLGGPDALIPPIPGSCAAQRG